MELTKRKWYCRYVEEYLAIGEAPEQVRNCFQQRSRWCKVSGPGPMHPHPLTVVQLQSMLNQSKIDVQC